MSKKLGSSIFFYTQSGKCLFGKVLLLVKKNIYILKKLGPSIFFYTQIWKMSLR
jgi:hypothetical protein